MPCVCCMRAGVALSNVHSLPHLFRLPRVSAFPNFHDGIVNFAVQAGTIRSRLAQRCRNPDNTLIGSLCHALGSFEPFHPQSVRKYVDSCRSRGTSISSARNQAAEDASFGSYRTLALPCSWTLEVKKSKFIAAATSVNDEAAARSFLSQDAYDVKVQIRDSSASHNCWAFKIGHLARFSDDGEPGGTAGRPILTAISSSGIDHVMVVVTRFFGGTKLGTGGLVRAYGKVTSDCLKDADTVIIKAKVFLKLRAPYDALGLLYPLLRTYGVQKLEEKFDVEGDGGVTMSVIVDAENLRSFERDLDLTTKGRASLSDVITC